MSDPPLIATPLSRPAELAKEWRALATGARNVFATPEFLDAWWEFNGRGRERLTFAVRREGTGELVAVLPLYCVRGRPLSVVRFAGHGVGEELGPVCRPADVGEVAACIRRTAASLGWDIVVGEQLRGDLGWSDALGARTLVREPNPVLRLGRSWDDILAERSSSTRKELRRKERDARRDSSLRTRTVRDPEELPGALDRLFALHRTRWPDGQSAFTPHERLHRAFAATALDRGWLHLSFLELEGEVAAAWYGFRFAGVQSHYQSGRDPRFDDRSAGLVHIVCSIREAIDAGLEEYRFLRGPQAYKDSLSDSDPGLETVAYAPGRRGSAALALLPAARRLRRLAR